MSNRRQAANDVADERAEAAQRGIKIRKTIQEQQADKDEVDQIAMLIMGTLAKGTTHAIRKRALVRAGQMLSRTGARPGQR